MFFLCVYLNYVRIFVVNGIIDFYIAPLRHVQRDNNQTLWEKRKVQVNIPCSLPDVVCLQKKKQKKEKQYLY